VNYATGAITFDLDSGYNPTGNLVARYYCNLADLCLVYADNPGAWGDDVAPYIDDIDVDNNTFEIEVWERQLVSGQYISSFTNEAWIVSREEKADGFNQALYLEERVNDNSYYVRVLDNDNIAETAALPASSLPHSTLAFASSALDFMDGGDNGLAVTVASYITALDLYSNKEDINVSIVVDTLGDPTYQAAIANLTDRDRGGRGDCYGITYVPLSAEQSTNYATEIINYRNYTQNLNTSWCGLYVGHVKIYDTYNGRYIFLPPSGFVAAAFSYTADQYEPWFPAAGWRRGLLPVLDVYRKYTQGERDLFYDNGVNAMRFRPGKGIAIWGQKTLHGSASALDRANVRWLLIVIENAIEEFLEDFIFELNTALTRRQVQMGIASYLQSIKNRDGLYEFEVVCDESNNTPEDIDNYRLNVDPYVQPVKAAEFLTQRVVITRTGVDFGDVRIA
jgi:hypothetical protein